MIMRLVSMLLTIAMALFLLLAAKSVPIFHRSNRGKHRGSGIKRTGFKGVSSARLREACLSFTWN